MTRQLTSGWSLADSSWKVSQAKLRLKIAA
jgi:hypothetical protein